MSKLRLRNLLLLFWLVILMQGRPFLGENDNLEELINEPTQIRDDGTQSCIDLICSDESFIFTKSGVLPSLAIHSEHQIIHGNLNFSVPCPPPYKRKIWDYKSGENIRYVTIYLTLIGKGYLLIKVSMGWTKYFQKHFLTSFLNTFLIKL